MIHRAVTLLLLGVVLPLLKSILYTEKQDSSLFADDVQQLCLLVLQITYSIENSFKLVCFLVLHCFGFFS